MVRPRSDWQERKINMATNHEDSGASQWGEYERLLEQAYPDLPDEWDMYEDTESLRHGFAEGKTAQQMFNARHAWWIASRRPSAPTYEYDGSEFGD